MGWKIMVVLGMAVLWIIWPAIRIPKGNIVRRKLGAFGTYLLLILGFLALLQLAETLLKLSR